MSCWDGTITDTLDVEQQEALQRWETRMDTKPTLGRNIAIGLVIGAAMFVLGYLIAAVLAL